MGESIDGQDFTAENSEEFKKRVRNETNELRKMLEGRVFCYEEVPKIGLEVEAWLVDKNAKPNPKNREFLTNCKNKNIVEELAQFNFELNTEPEHLTDSCFSRFEEQIGATWSESQALAKDVGASTCMVGIHPLINAGLLTPKYMSHGTRYKALCDRLLFLRDGKPVSIDIQGEDHYVNKLGHIMMESAATSIQVHIQANQENFKRLFNASLIGSAATVAVAANSPFFDGHCLWDETRIPLFEQAVRVASFNDKRGNEVGRVTFGTGYIKRSPLELYLENLDGYPPLIPILFDEDCTKLRHLSFHNGTLWRWNRPIVGVGDETSHLRIEQRVMASGPTIPDIVANAAFSVGLTLSLANQKKVPEESMTFTDCKQNFYSASKYGLNAKVRWFGNVKLLRSLILETLIPQAREGLQSAGVSKQDIEKYIDDIIEERVRRSQNGSEWQKAFLGSHGKNFENLAMAYQANQETGKPVHTWEI